MPLFCAPPPTATHSWYATASWRSSGSSPRSPAIPSRYVFACICMFVCVLCAADSSARGLHVNGVFNICKLWPAARLYRPLPLRPTPLTCSIAARSHWLCPEFRLDSYRLRPLCNWAISEIASTFSGRSTRVAIPAHIPTYTRAHALWRRSLTLTRCSSTWRRARRRPPQWPSSRARAARTASGLWSCSRQTTSPNPRIHTDSHAHTLTHAH